MCVCKGVYPGIIHDWKKYFLILMRECKWNRRKGAQVVYTKVFHAALFVAVEKDRNKIHHRVTG